MLALLAGCQTTPTTATTDDVCLIWQPQSFSGANDTPETVAEARKRNAIRDAYCKVKRK